MDESGQTQAGDATPAQAGRDLVMRFESLGGAGHGCEFGLFQRHYGAEPLGLLRWADLDHTLLMTALETRFDGVGQPEHTIVFNPDHSDEWWTRDARFWMAMRSFMKTADIGLAEMTETACRRIQFLRRKLIEDLTNGEKIFVFKNMYRDLTEAEVARLHAAVRSYGDSTLLYVRYADETHAPGTVEVAGLGLMIGYIDHFAFSREDTPLSPAHEAWFQICERAHRLASGSVEHFAPEPEAPPPVRPAKTARARRVVVVGNCQMLAMKTLYDRFVGVRTGDTLDYVASYLDMTPEGQQTIEQADVIVEQLFDLTQQTAVAQIAPNTPRVFVPMVTAAFLWPFSGSAHPNNVGYPYMLAGPYGGEAGDSYLNRLIAAGTDPEEAVETYANLEVNRRVNLDRLFELVIDRHRARDAAADYQISDLIERHFRSEQIFLSPYHPNVRIATALAEQFCRRLGAPQSGIDLMLRCTRTTPFPKTELPLHPSVCAHWGMDFIGPDRRYRFMNEGLFTFREYALRYMRYEWNEPLEEGMHLAQAGQPERARDQLIAGLVRSPRSAQGHNTLSHIMASLGDIDNAISEARRAVEIEPDAPEFRAQFGGLLRQAGHNEVAIAQIRSAISLDPADPHTHGLLAHLLRQAGKIDDACEHMRIAVSLDPYKAGLHVDLADFLEAKGDKEGALTAIQAAIALAPDDAGIQGRTTTLLQRMSKLPDAIGTARVAVLLAPASAAARVTLSLLLQQEGQADEALTEAYIATVCEPDHAPAYAHLGQMLRSVQDLTGAEHAFRRAADLAPANAHLRHEVSTVLLQSGRLAEAAAPARAAAELEPANPHRWVYLAELLAQSGDLSAARAAQRQALTIDPKRVEFRLVLSDLYAREHRLDEALAEAQWAVADSPDSAQALGHLGHITEMMGNLAEAERLFRKAIGMQPDNENFQRQLHHVLNAAEMLTSH